MCCDNETIDAKIENLRKKVEPVEKIVQEHPIPSVLIGIGAGLVAGALIGKYYRRE